MIVYFFYYKDSDDEDIVEQEVSLFDNTRVVFVLCVLSDNPTNSDTCNNNS
jgi:hypothetical protein